MNARFVSGFVMTDYSMPWGADWVWGLPLIVLTVLIHVWGLGTVRRKAFGAISHSAVHSQYQTKYFVIISCATLAATALHITEAIVWALAYRTLNALPDIRSATLYSLNAITSYGHTDLDLQAQWRLMGALEALNGWLLFGLSTAFLISILRKLRDPESK